MSSKKEGGTAARELETLREEFKTLHGDMKQLMKAIKDDDTSQLEDISKRMVERAKSLEDNIESSVRNAYTNVHDYGKRMAEKASDDIRSHPVRYLVIAFAAGIGFGKLFGKG